MDMGWVIQVVIYANVFLVGVVLTLAVQSWRAHRSGKNQNVGIEALPQSVRDEVIDHARTHYQRAIYRSAVQLDKNLAATATKLNESLVSLRDAVSEGEMSQYNEVLNTIRRQAANIVGATSEQISAHQKELRKHFEDHQAALDLELQKAENATELQLQQHQQDYQKRQADMEAQLLEHQKQLEAALAKRQQELTANATQLEARMMDLQKSYIAKQQQMEASLEANIDARRQQLVGKLEAELADTILAFLSDALGSNVDLGAQAASLTSLLDEHKDELLKGVKK